MQVDSTAIEAARRGDEGAFAGLLEPYRRELRAHCYRMSGSLHDADDLLQESMLRAWKGLPAFEGRSSLRTWLYKVTTSACLDALGRRAPRTLPAALAGPADPAAPLGPARPESVWLEPCPDELVDPAPSPEARVSARQSVAFAFLVALQLLPPQQRAVLILRDVLGWQASECAELLELSVAAVNSALQRARATVEGHAGAQPAAPSPPLDDGATASLLARYVRAWESADVPALVSILREDATLAMPPLAEWLSGAAAIGQSIAAMVLGPGRAGAFSLLPLRANAQPAFAAYEDGRATAIHVLALDGDRIAGIIAFVEPSLFPRFGLPSTLPAAPAATQAPAAPSEPSEPSA